MMSNFEGLEMVDYFRHLGVAQFGGKGIKFSMMSVESQPLPIHQLQNTNAAKVVHAEV
jgi:hypothetical protein